MAKLFMAFVIVVFINGVGVDNFLLQMEQADRNFIDDMTRMVIRPYRDIYTIEKLGPPQMIVKGKTNSNNDRPAFKYVQITRKDQTVDCKGKKIHLSYFSPTQPQSKKGEQSNKNRRCVVYLHANSGSRIEGLDLVKYILPFGWSMAIFDYRGSGVSEGEYTSMGVNQSQDLEKVLQHLGCTQKVSQFCLWGRSMGAVTILYYLTKQYYWNNLHSNTIVRAVVLDSPFSNMQKLMYQIGSSKITLPEFVFTPIINSITERITIKLGFNLIKELDLIDRVKQLKQKNMDAYKLIGKISALFLTSLEDKLIKSSHVQTLHQHFPFHPNDLHYFNGQHNDNRSDHLKNKCAQFLCEIPQRKIQQKIGVTSLKKSDLDLKKLIQQPKKELQFLLPHRKDLNSPKFKYRKDVRTLTEDPTQQVKSSKIMQEMKQSRSQMPNQQPTIIINNNYNVSVNLYDHQKTQLDQPIPPISFKPDEAKGSLTDRLSDNPIIHKYFGPYTTKVEKRQNEHNHTFNVSSPTSNSSNSNLYRKNQLNKTANKQVNNQSFSKLDIPKIKFQGIDYNIEKQEQARQKLSSRQTFQRQRVIQHQPKLGPPPNIQQPLIAMYSSQPPKYQENEKSKLSLAELRKAQKQQQEKCVMKTSKVISIKDKNENNDDFERIHLKSQGNHHQDNKSQKQKVQPGMQRMNSAGSRQIKSLKTSLMQKRRAVDRKNSEASQTMKNSYLNQFKKQQKEKDKQGLTNSQHFLEYRFKIQHL